MKKIYFNHFSEINKLKNKFKKQQLENQKKFFKNISGKSNCIENTKTVDSLIQSLFNLLGKKSKQNLKDLLICAVGGYGRKQLAPFSDIDLLFIYRQKGNLIQIKKLIQIILYPLWDLKLNVGYAVRSYREVIEFSKKDHVIKTSMLDARLVCGSSIIFKNLMKDYFDFVSKNSRVFLSEKINERNNKIKQIGFDYFRNEPNVKEGEGSIRDLNLIIWSLKIFQINREKKVNKHLDFLSTAEKKQFNNAQNFLLTIRCFLHYLSKRPNEKLTFDYQQIISVKINRKNSNTVLNSQVEDMMRNYFEQIAITRNLAKIISNILVTNLKQKVSQKKPTQSLKKINSRFMKGLLNNSSNLHDFRKISSNINSLKKIDLFTSENLEIFKKIFFSQNQRKFMELYDVGILSKIIPEFQRINYLTQFDRYHALTVGQHTLKAINILKEIKKKGNEKSYIFSKLVFSKKFSKKPLFYATLLHDIGKGYKGEHSEKGKILAKKILARLNEKEDVVEDTIWLIKNHLLMSEIAFKKDIEDYSVIKMLSKNISNLKRLRSLFLLTVADISAVDQGIWNHWKATLLTSLFKKVEEEILLPNRSKSLNKKIILIKNKVKSLKPRIDKSDFETFSKITYPNYWLLQSPSSISFQIQRFFFKGKKKKNFDFHLTKIDDKNFFTLTVVTNDRPLLFLDLISIFILEKISIFESRIFTLDDKTVIDTFKVSIMPNVCFSKKDFEDKIISLKNNIDAIGKGFKPRVSVDMLPQKKTIREKLEVKIDNKSSSTYTVLEVITNDRPGLLYLISNVLIKNKIIISMAKISTNGDFVEDSFHLRNEYGLKIDKRNILIKIEQEIKSILLMKEKNVC